MPPHSISSHPSHAMSPTPSHPLLSKESQKGIIIGTNGAAIKRVGIRSRKLMEDFFQKQVHVTFHPTSRRQSLTTVCSDPPLLKCITAFEPTTEQHISPSPLYPRSIWACNCSSTQCAAQPQCLTRVAPITDLQSSLLSHMHPILTLQA